MFKTVKRDLDALQKSNVVDQFDRVHRAVTDLEPRVATDFHTNRQSNLDSIAIRRAIDDVKRYMKTLTGEMVAKFTLEDDTDESQRVVKKRLLAKDRLPITERILVDRLTAIDTLVDAIIAAQEDPDKEADLIERYETVRKQLKRGFIPQSNLKNILASSLFQYDPQIPDKFMCPIAASEQIMLDPVIANDGHNYEREIIEYHIEQNGGPGLALSPFNRNVQLTGNLFPNNQLKAEIEDFLKKYPKMKSERYVLGDFENGLDVSSSQYGGPEKGKQRIK